MDIKLNRIVISAYKLVIRSESNRRYSVYFGLNLEPIYLKCKS